MENHGKNRRLCSRNVTAQPVENVVVSDMNKKQRQHNQHVASTYRLPCSSPHQKQHRSATTMPVN